MKKLNLFSPVSNLGYGIVGLNILKSLSSKLDISLTLIGNMEGTQHDAQLAQEAIDKATLFDGFADAPCLKIWHEFALHDRIGRGPSFAFPFFEINKFDQRRINHLKSVDGIIVASKWAKEIIKEHVDVPPALVSVIPLGVDSTIFQKGPHQITDKCVFFNCGKWEKRKGHDILLEMFKQAFPNEKDVELWMMCSNPFLSPQTGFAKVAHEWERYYRSDPRVKLIDRVPTHAEVADIMSQTNCGVFPSRAEGWNLELLEMMSMGKDVITTNYSAHTEFCTPENAHLMEIENLEKAEDGLFFDGSSGEWASLEGKPFSQGVEYMRNFYEKWKKDANQYNTEGIKTAERLSWDRTAQHIEDTIYGNQG